MPDTRTFVRYPSGGRSAHVARFVYCSMKTGEWMERIAATDRTFRREGARWIGKCLICNGPLAFDAGTGVGANIEHIVPRAQGGTNDLLNLGITHPRCNGEKGVHWDAPRRHRTNRDRYTQIVDRLLAERRRRWHDPV